ncbi:MAG: HNH/ENDO VII family nuclease, partial [Micrococcales bacterium]|nr:HNH/ENDO VII family nuclease [Micrococcales bacterium]
GYPSDGMPETGVPGSYGYDGQGKLLAYANDRPSYAPGQVEEVWRKASPAWEWDEGTKTWNRLEDIRDAVRVQDVDGNWYWVEWDPVAGGPRDWDMGHLPDHEYRKLRDRYLSGDVDVDTFLAEYHNPDRYGVQDPGRNRAHMDETP